VSQQHAVNVEEPVGLAGIGVLFERSGAKSQTTIRSIQPLSSADREGTLRQGDELVAVNGNDTSGWDLGIHEYASEFYMMLSILEVLLTSGI
jgi:C-terminal processing protease CtpA/Prc